VTAAIQSVLALGGSHRPDGASARWLKNHLGLTPEAKIGYDVPIL
jgi:hypothetical protein